MKFGAIDIGTNAARLLIGEVCQSEDHNYVKKISYTRIPLRLGEDVFEIGKISKEKSKHTLDTIKAFKLIAKIFEVNRIRAVATSAITTIDLTAVSAQPLLLVEIKLTVKTPDER